MDASSILEPPHIFRLLPVSELGQVEEARRHARPLLDVDPGRTLKVCQEGTVHRVRRGRLAGESIEVAGVCANFSGQLKDPVIFDVDVSLDGQNAGQIV
jgi:hypothetical protein